MYEVALLLNISPKDNRLLSDAELPRDQIGTERLRRAISTFKISEMTIPGRTAHCIAAVFLSSFKVSPSGNRFKNPTITFRNLSTTEQFTFKVSQRLREIKMGDLAALEEFDQAFQSVNGTDSLQYCRELALKLSGYCPKRSPAFQDFSRLIILAGLQKIIPAVPSRAVRSKRNTHADGLVQQDLFSSSVPTLQRRILGETDNLLLKIQALEIARERALQRMFLRDISTQAPLDQKSRAIVMLALRKLIQARPRRYGYSAAEKKAWENAGKWFMKKLRSQAKAQNKREQAHIDALFS